MYLVMNSQPLAITMSMVPDAIMPCASWMAVRLLPHCRFTETPGTVMGNFLVARTPERASVNPCSPTW